MYQVTPKSITRLSLSRSQLGDPRGILLWAGNWGNAVSLLASDFYRTELSNLLQIKNPHFRVNLFSPKTAFLQVICQKFMRPFIYTITIDIIANPQTFANPFLLRSLPLAGTFTDVPMKPSGRGEK
jgi:hypothetical protein